jgi:hypothetical protein
VEAAGPAITMVNHTITRISPKVILISSIRGIPMATNITSSNTAA